MRGFLFLRLSQYVVGNSSVDGDQVEAADADNCVDDAAQPRHVSEDQGDEVERKNPIRPQLTAPMIATVSAV